jgi:hypothetical protein
MIRTKLEYIAAKVAMEKLKGTLSNIDNAVKGLKSWAKETYYASIEGQLMELQNQLYEYETMKAGDVNKLAKIGTKGRQKGRHRGL